jgi:hypothetical protein
MKKFLNFRIAAQKTLTDEINKINREKEIENRKIQIDSLKDQIDKAKSDSETQKEILKTTLDDKKTKLDQDLENTKTKLATDLANYKQNETNKLNALKARVELEKVAIDAKTLKEIQLIQQERIAKETAETAKYNAAKSTLDKEEAALDGFTERYKAKLDAELKLKQDTENAKLKAVTDRIKKEQDAEDKAIIESTKKVEKQFDVEKETATIKALQKKLDDLDAKLKTFWGKTLPNSIAKVATEKQIESEKQRLHDLGIPGYAKGVNNFSGGLAIVGERGPELVNLPKGSDVIPNSQTQQMLGSNFAGMITGNTFIVRSDNDIKLIAREFYNLQTSRSRGNGVIAAT